MKPYITPTDNDGTVRLDVMLIELIDSLELQIKGNIIQRKPTERTQQIFTAVIRAASTE